MYMRTYAILYKMNTTSTEYRVLFYGLEESYPNSADEPTWFLGYHEGSQPPRAWCDWRPHSQMWTWQWMATTATADPVENPPFSPRKMSAQVNSSWKILILRSCYLTKLMQHPPGLFRLSPWWPSHQLDSNRQHSLEGNVYQDETI